MEIVKIIEIASSLGAIEPCNFRFVIDGGVDVFMMSQIYGVRHFKASNIFDALIEVRTLLEKDGYLLLCNSARKDAYPSRMSLEMGGGRKIYRLTHGQQTNKSDLIDVLDAAMVDEVGTILEQKDNYKNWIRSLK